MAIRYLLLAALVGSAFSAHAAPGEIYASTGTGTVLLATTTTGQVQTYMPHAVQSFVMFTAPAAAAPAPATALLGGSVQSVVPPASAELLAPASELVVQAPAPAELTTAPAELTTAPAELTTAPAELTTAPAGLTLADLVGVGVSTPIVSELLVPEADAGLTGNTVAAVGPTEVALDATAVPEPATGGLMLAGLAGVGFMARRRRSR
jgi:hypothetical protein